MSVDSPGAADVAKPNLEHADVVGDATALRTRSTLYWVGVLLLLVLLSEEVAYAFNLVTPALPLMATKFHTTQVAWVATAFQLAGACTAPLLGKFADAVGKKRMLLVVTATMVLGSLVVALAPSFPLVLLGRTLEGVGTAILPITYSLMRDIFPKRMLALAVSIATAGIGVTGIVAPNIAGWLIDHDGYRAVFLFLAVFPAVVGLLILLFVPESPIRVRTKIDWVGGILLGAALTLLLLSISEGATWGWVSGRTLGTGIGGLALLAAWWIYERRTTFPLMDLVLIRSRAVATTMAANFIAQAVIVINFVLLAYLVQTPAVLGAGYGLGESASDLAHFTSPGGAISVAMGFVVGWLAQRRGPRLPGWVGFVFAAAGTLLLAANHYTTWQLVIGYFVYAVGGGLISAAIPNLVIAAVPVQEQAVSANMVGVIGSLGSAVGLQIAFAVLGQHVHTVIKGTPIYADAGFTVVYVITGLAAVLGVIVTLWMRHGRRPESHEASEEQLLVGH
jgi:MFS family permease